MERNGDLIQTIGLEHGGRDREQSRGKAEVPRIIELGWGKVAGWYVRNLLGYFVSVRY